MKRTIYSIRWDKKLRCWTFWRGKARLGAYTGATKKLVIQSARYEMRHISLDGTWLQLRCFGKDGRIQWEATYPRSSDPKRSKG